MHLTVYQPLNVFLDIPVKKIVGESPRGSFGLLPRHIDFVTALVPGILTYVTEAGKLAYLAVNGGILVKQQDQVNIVTPTAVSGELGELKSAVHRFVHETDESEKKVQTAVARLEAGFIRRFMEMEKNA